MPASGRSVPQRAQSVRRTETLTFTEASAARATFGTIGKATLAYRHRNRALAERRMGKAKINRLWLNLKDD